MRDTTFNLSDMYKEPNLYYQKPMDWNDLWLMIYMGLCRYKKPERLIKYIPETGRYDERAYQEYCKVLIKQAKDIVKEYQNIGFTPEQAYNNDIWHEVYNIWNNYNYNKNFKKMF